MTEVLVDVNVPYPVVYIPRRCRNERSSRLWTKRKISIANPSAGEAPAAFRVKSATPMSEPENSYDIRFFNRALWWPVYDRNRSLMRSSDFLEGLASGTYEALQILIPKLLWFSGYQPTYEDYFRDRIGHRIVQTGEDLSYAEIQGGVARVMLCNGLVYFEGGTPLIFGCWTDGSSDQSAMSLRVGSSASGLHPPLLGPSIRLKGEALWEGHVFDPSRLDREIELLESRGLKIRLEHKIEGACDISRGDMALHFCAHAAVKRLFTISSTADAAYRNLIPHPPPHDRSELVPLDICRTILSNAVQRSWPKGSGDRHLSVALADATSVLERFDLVDDAYLTPEDEDALRSL